MKTGFYPPWVVLHIPHDSVFIPEDVRSSFLLSKQELEAELRRMTDHFTQALFAGRRGSAAVIRAPVSRLVVDVERFADDAGEPMAATRIADLKAMGAEGLTVLQRAGIHRHRDVGAVLIELGADPVKRLVKFTDMPAGQEIQYEMLSGLADKLDGAVEALSDLEAVTPALKAKSARETKGFWARLFGWGPRPRRSEVERPQGNRLYKPSRQCSWLQTFRGRL